MSGGTIGIQWSNADSATVDILTEAGVSSTAFTVAGSAVTFPYALVSGTRFATAIDGRFTVSVKQGGREIADTPDGTRVILLENGAQFVFAPSADTSTGFVSRSSQVFDVADYGAVADGVTDATAAVRAAFTAANALKRVGPGGNIWAPGATVRMRGTFLLSSIATPIDVSCNLDAADASVLVPLAYAGAVLKVGHPTSGNVLHNAKIRLPGVTKLNADTALTELTAGSVGVQVQNLHHSDLTLGRTTAFETGAWFTGLGQGTVYNTIDIGWIDVCKVAVKLAPQSGGWVSQNAFVGGGVSQSPFPASFPAGAAVRRSGFRHLVIDGSAGTGTANANSFVGVSFEGDLSEYYFDIKYASQNTWSGSCRFEHGTAATATTLSTDTFTSTAHGLAVGDMVVFFATSSRPGGMTTAVKPYYVFSVPTADTFKVAEIKGAAAAISFSSNGSGVIYYTPPRILFDGTGGNTFGNEIKSGYYSYPGPLDIRYTSAPVNNPVAPSVPLLGALPGRNKIINGDFRINQRGYVSAANINSGNYCFDRWKSTNNGTQLAYTSAPQGQPVTINSGGSIAQFVERGNIEPGTYTLSWTGYATGRVYNSGASAPSYAASPITVDIDGSTDVVVEFTTASFLYEVQLERSLVATPFERVPTAVAMVQCQRYFQRLGRATGATVREPVGAGSVTTTTSAIIPIHLPVAMRTTPTLTTTSPTTLRVNDSNTIVNPTSVALSNSTEQNLRLSVSVASGLTAGDGIFMDTGDSNALLDLSAEL